MIYSPQKGLHYSLREIFTGIEKVENIANDIWPILRKDFITIRLEW